jgi:glycosyltransferase involved in cell wall biosynthesis
LAWAYGIDERVEIRPPGATERAGDGTLEVDATRSTPAALCDLFREFPSPPAGRRELDALLAGRRVAVVTNIPIHYRVALFNVVAKRLSAVDGALHVLFTCGIPSDRGWISPPEMRFDHAFVTSIDLGRSRGRRMLPRDLGAHLSRTRPDIVVAAGFSPFVAGQAARWCRKGDIPFGLWSGEIMSHPTAKSPARRFQRRRLMRRVDFAVAYGWESARYLEFLEPRLPVVIGRNTTALPMPSPKRRASGPLELLAVSRVEKHKALDLVVAAVMRIPDSAVRLTIVGDGPQIGALRTMAAGSQRIRFAGSLPHEEVLETYGAADAFAFPTTYDVFGLVLVEAMAAGLTVISSNIPGALADLAVEGSNCIVIREPSVEAWCVAIRRIAEDPGLRQRMGIAAANTVRRRWTLEHAAEAMLAGFRLGALRSRPQTGTVSAR